MYLAKHVFFCYYVNEKAINSFAFFPNFIYFGIFFIFVLIFGVHFVLYLWVPFVCSHLCSLFVDYLQLSILKILLCFYIGWFLLWILIMHSFIFLYFKNLLNDLLHKICIGWHVQGMSDTQMTTSSATQLFISDQKVLHDLPPQKNRNEKE